MGDMKEPKKRGKTTESVARPEDRGTDGGVSEMRGEGDTGTERIRRDALPGVSAGDGTGKSSVVSQRAKRLGAKALNYESLGIDDKISVLNAFRKISEKTPSVERFGDVAQAVVAQKYEQWVRSEIDALLGQGQSLAHGFTEDQTAVLREFASRLIASAGKPQAQVQPQSQPQQKPGQPATKPSPLRESVDLNKYTRDQVQILRKLEEMDRNGPDF